MTTTRWLGVGLAAVAAAMGGLLMAAVAFTSAAAADEEDQRRIVRAALADACTVAAPSGTQRTGQWSKEQRKNAITITAVAKERRLPPRAAQIAVATAIQESRLRNLPYGDRDSLGLFQQRPSQGWGNPAQVRDPVYAAGQFYGRLVKVNGWQTMPLTVAAQKVQRSGFPAAYGQWEDAAKTLVETVWKDADLPDGALEGGEEICTPDNDGGGGSLPSVPASKRAMAVITAARSQFGENYVWGGGNQNGPTKGGFDCSGLTVYAVYQGTGGNVTLPRTSQTQRNAGTHVDKKDMEPGDLIVINNDGNWGHVGLYTGNGRMIHAPRTGKTVEETKLENGYWDKFPWEVRRVL